jgi:hypothetical protein
VEDVEAGAELAAAKLLQQLDQLRLGLEEATEESGSETGREN